MKDNLTKDERKELKYTLGKIIEHIRDEKEGIPEDENKRYRELRRKRLLCRSSE